MTSTRIPASPARIAALFNHQVIDDDTGMAWKHEGLCGQTDPELFYPEKGMTAAVPKRICARCPVRRACLDHALVHHEPYGVWGGTTPDERKQLLVNQARRPRTAA